MPKTRMARYAAAALTFARWSYVGVHTGFIEMRSHVLRSILSAIGILFGVFVMVAMLSLIGGLNTFLNKRMGEWMGSVFIEKINEPPKEKLAEFSRSRGLTFSDGIFLQDSVPSVRTVYKSIERFDQLLTIGGQTRAHFMGVDSQTLAKQFTMDIELDIKEGRMLDASDFSDGSLVCMVSSFIAEDITRKLETSGKTAGDIIGSSIYFKNQRFRIIGVFGPKKADVKRWWMRNNVYVPLVAMQKYVSGYNPDPGHLWLQVDDPLLMDKQLDDVVSNLIARHRGVEDFEYRKPDNLKEFISMMGNVSLIMGIIAAISLLAGGLGIMNVMLSSISERIREIGIRKALGASTVQIFVQFIAETSTLCFIGGTIGALFGCVPMLIGDAIEKATGGGINPTLLPQYILAMVVVIASMGVIFGLYPAVKASRMNPIDALRYE